MGNVYVQKRGNVFQYQFQIASVNGKESIKIRVVFQLEMKHLKRELKHIQNM